MISESDRQELQLARFLLENPGFAIKITNIIGSPFEQVIKKLPATWSHKLGEITQKALLKASEAAIFTMKDIPGQRSSNKWHTIGVAASGGAGGFFGLAALAIELPVSTTIMLRSIAEIARSEGESITSTETKLACLEVFALGGNRKSDDGSETGYYAVRAFLAKSINEAAKFIAERGFAEESAPILVRLITKISQRFGIQITQKAAALAIPAIGAVTGAIINTIFMDHFQDMARGHFIVRKLERAYGTEIIQEVYKTLPNSKK